MVIEIMYGHHYVCAINLDNLDNLQKVPSFSLVKLNISNKLRWLIKGMFLHHRLTSLTIMLIKSDSVLR